MSCTYKYRGKDYTKEEFYSLVSNSNSIQQEQVKKFAELQERLNNKEFLEGAKNAFESSKELQNVYYEAAGFVRSDKVLSENYENYFSEIQDMNSAIFDNLENADLLYTHYQIKEVDIDTLDISKKTAGYSNNASDYLKNVLKSVKDQKTPILINGRGGSCRRMA
jgi:hypothetical protein